MKTDKRCKILPIAENENELKQLTGIYNQSDVYSLAQAKKEKYIPIYIESKKKKKKKWLNQQND